MESLEDLRDVHGDSTQHVVGSLMHDTPPPLKADEMGRPVDSVNAIVYVLRHMLSCDDLGMLEKHSRDRQSVLLPYAWQYLSPKNKKMTKQRLLPIQKTLMSELLSRIGPSISFENICESDLMVNNFWARPQMHAISSRTVKLVNEKHPTDLPIVYGDDEEARESLFILDRSRDPEETLQGMVDQRFNRHVDGIGTERTLLPATPSFLRVKYIPSENPEHALPISRLRVVKMPQVDAKKTKKGLVFVSGKPPQSYTLHAVASVKTESSGDVNGKGDRVRLYQRNGLEHPIRGCYSPEDQEWSIKDIESRTFMLFYRRSDDPIDVDAPERGDQPNDDPDGLGAWLNSQAEVPTSSNAPVARESSNETEVDDSQATTDGSQTTAEGSQDSAEDSETAAEGAQNETIRNGTATRTRAAVAPNKRKREDDDSED